MEDIFTHSKTCEGVDRKDISFTFVCIQCSYHSRQRNHFERHFRRHTDEKPFRCEHCEYKSPREDHMTSHKRRKHLLEKTSTFVITKKAVVKNSKGEFIFAI
uniref:Zinc finger protein 518B n=1 Tax=Cacopsylla melanoneura TaxID=428564 RepID=A0A8D8LSA1_9HEMI